jgi:hypothetical protein
MWYGDLHALAEEAARARGMKLTQRFGITPLDDQAFLKRYAAIVHDRAKELAVSLEAVMRAFHLDRAGGTRPSTIVRQAQEVQDEQLIAFYDFATHNMYLRQRLPESVRNLGDDFQLAILAHEVGHVLQDQRDAEAAFTRSNNFDTVMAARGVLEGDATLTATLVAAQRKGWTPSRGVERSRVGLTLLTPSQSIEAMGLSPKLAGASPLVREMTLFPYFRGARLMFDLYRTGELALVDAVVQRPPSMTEAVDAAQRWLDGYVTPIKPLGSDGGLLGSMMLRVLVDSCRIDAPWLATYRGDAWTRTPEAPLVWSTVWSSELDAGAAATSLAKLGACWDLKDDDLVVRRQGTTVAVVVAAPGARDAAVALALNAVSSPESPPPFGRRTIPEVEHGLAFRSAGAGTWTGTHWHNDKLALDLEAPPPVQPIPNPAASLTASGPGFMMLGVFVDDTPSTRNRDQFLNALLRTFAMSAFKEAPAGLNIGTPHLWQAGESSDSYLFKNGTLKLSVRTRAIALCKGSAAFFLVGLSTHEAGKSSVDAWFNGLHTTTPDPPICSAQ